MLLLFSIFIAGGSAGGSQADLIEESIDAYRKGMKKVIEDDDRKEAALAEVETVREEFKTQVKALGDATTAYIAVDHSYHSTTNDYDPALDEFLGAWEAMDRWSIDKHYDLQGYFTDDEWVEAMARVSDNTVNLLEDSEEMAAKLEKKHKKKIAKYEKKFGQKYTPPAVPKAQP